MTARNIITVVVTYYNKGRLLHDALESLYLQTYNEFEIVVVNDCSDEQESQSIWNEMKGSEKYKNKLSLYELDKNYGASYAKNFGVRKASGDIIALLDADDVLPPTAIEDILRSFQKYSNASVLFGNYSHNRKTIDCSVICTQNKSEIHIPTLLNNWKLLGTSPFKKKAFEEIGGFNILYPKIDDTDFHMRLLLGGYVFKYIEKNIYTWNDVEDSNGKSVNRSDSAKLFFRNIDIFIHYFPISKFLIKFLKNGLIVIIEKIFYKKIKN